MAEIKSTNSANLVSELVKQFHHCVLQTKCAEGASLKAHWAAKGKQIACQMQHIATYSDGALSPDVLKKVTEESEALTSSLDVFESCLAPSSKRLVLFNPDEVARKGDERLIDASLRVHVELLKEEFAPGSILPNLSLLQLTPLYP